MANIKETIKLGYVKHEAATYIGGKDGYTIFMTIENLGDKSIEVEVQEFYLVQDMELKFDYLYSGYMGKEATILPFSKKSIGRIWYKSSMNTETIEEGNYIIAVIVDKTNKKQYLTRYDYDGTSWTERFLEIRKTKK